MRVLVVEDDPALAGVLVRGLTRCGMAVDHTDRGEEALWRAQATPYEAIVLDVMLPGLDGVSVCRRLRDDGVATPILLLTARDAVPDRVHGLDAGADDYLTKPFAWDELEARLRALARRGAVAKPAVIEVGDLRLDPARREAWRGGEPVELAPQEFAILQLFMRRPGDVLSRLDILEGAWDAAYENRSNVVDVYVAGLRRKLDRPGEHSCIETVRGVGYRLRET